MKTSCKLIWVLTPLVLVSFALEPDDCDLPFATMRIHLGVHPTVEVIEQAELQILFKLLHMLEPDIAKDWDQEADVDSKLKKLIEEKLLDPNTNQPLYRLRQKSTEIPGEYEFAVFYTPQREETLTENKIITVAMADYKENAFFLTRTFYRNYNWVRDSAERVNKGSQKNISIAEFMRDTVRLQSFESFLKECQAIIFVGAASASGEQNYNDQLCVKRANKLKDATLECAKGLLSGKVIYRFHLGKHQGTSDSENEDQRPMIMIGLISCDPSMLKNPADMEIALIRALEGDREFWLKPEVYTYKGTYDRRAPKRLEID